VPSEAINRARAPFPGEPSFVLLESRAFVVGLLVGVGVKVTPRLAVGLSVNALAVLRGTIDVTIDGAGRFTTQSEQRLLTRFAPILGARYRLRDDLDLGLAVRAPSRSDYDITVTSDLGDALPLTLPEIAIAGTRAVRSVDRRRRGGVARVAVADADRPPGVAPLERVPAPRPATRSRATRRSPTSGSATSSCRGPRSSTAARRSAARSRPGPATPST
jgi:hypothetical protein